MLSLDNLTVARLTMWIHSTLMSLLGHVVLTLTFDAFHYIMNRSSRNREGAVFLEEGLPLAGEQDMAAVEASPGELDVI